MDLSGGGRQEKMAGRLQSGHSRRISDIISAIGGFYFRLAVTDIDPNRPVTAVIAQFLSFIPGQFLFFLF
jgi:hypothetical protein